MSTYQVTCSIKSVVPLLSAGCLPSGSGGAGGGGDGGGERGREVGCGGAVGVDRGSEVGCVCGGQAIMCDVIDPRLYVQIICI